VIFVLEAMRYRRRAMQRLHTGTAKLTARMMRVAGYRMMSSVTFKYGRRTNIAPNRRPVDRISVPDDGVNELV